MSAAIEFKAVTVATAQNRRLLEDISLSVEAGTLTVLLGRSGSGKTTLLKTVNRMIEATSGAVHVNGASVRDANLIALRRGIGYVIQETGLFPHFTIERNVGIVLEAEGRTREERVQRSHELLLAVGLDPENFAFRYPHQLSGGQRQRVGLARALAAEPDILLMDEPFGALDPLTRSEMQDMLRNLLAGLNKTVLFVTHDLNEALYLGDQIALLGEGKLIASLPPDRFTNSEIPEIRQYVDAFQRSEPRSDARALRVKG